MALASVGGVWLILSREPARPAGVLPAASVAVVQPPPAPAAPSPTPATPAVVPQATVPALPSPPPVAPAPQGPTAAPTPVPMTIDFDVTMSCDKLPWSAGPLHQTASARVQAGKVEFTRIIRHPSGSGEVIGTEIGKGTLDRSGRMVIESAWGGRNHYKVRYEGTVTAKGGTMRGDQKWVFDGRSHSRPCALVLLPK
jgi:hypothetical protein